MGGMMKFLIVAAALVFTASTAHAAGACKADREKFCKDVKPGEGRLAACFKEHEAEVSAACKSHVAERVAKSKELAAACKDDREKLCPGVQPGKGRVAACFEDKAAQLSMGCKAKIATHGKQWKEARKACAADLKTHCASVKGHGEKFACLEQHEDALSAACKDEIDDLD